ncbi:MAG: hypothetical protein NW216_04235 [Hyphomicrobium sp.]|nr:hypothetical protein [Hyphomicrobium sp.]
MSAQAYLVRLGAILAAGAILYAVLAIAAGPRWTSFYGFATAALVTWPLLTLLLWTRLPQAGLSRWWTLLYALPVLVLSLVQIGYWTFFFTYGPTNPAFGVIRTVFRDAAGILLPIGEIALLALVALLFWRAGRTPQSGATTERR